jgi:hypothetical protein
MMNDKDLQDRARWVVETLITRYFAGLLEEAEWDAGDPARGEMASIIVEAFRDLPVCDCHTWPTVEEMHDYCVAIEKELVRLREPVGDEEIGQLLAEYRQELQMKGGWSGKHRLVAALEREHRVRKMLEQSLRRIQERAEANG